MLQQSGWTVRVEVDSALRVGGAEDPLSEISFSLANVGGVPVIPGSTLKGALRAQIEHYLLDSFYDTSKRRWSLDSLRPCVPGAPTKAEDQQLIRTGKFGPSCSYRGERGREGVCPACYLLGAQGLTGFLSVPILKPVSGSIGEQANDVPEPGLTASLYGIRQDRLTRTVARNLNWSYSLVRDDAAFEGTLLILEEDTVRGWRFGNPRQLPGNPDAWIARIGWTPDQLRERLVFDRLQAITELGGHRSKGMGRVRVTVRPQEA